MAHVWQPTHGKPPIRCYQGRQWAAKMKEIGLQPSTTGEPGGKGTGQSVTHPTPCAISTSCWPSRKPPPMPARFPLDAGLRHHIPSRFEAPHETFDN